jgi:enamine deaminase RidA (YjgF/YER057c/UK114 family)
MVMVSSFETPSGASEWHVMARTGCGRDVPGEIDRLGGACKAALSDHGLGDDTLVFTRFYLSDPPNQREFLDGSSVYAHALSGAVSVIRQYPAEGGSVAMYAYHVRGRDKAFPKKKVELGGTGDGNGVSVRGDRYEMAWLAGASGSGILDSCAQTTDVFGGYEKFLAGRGMNLFDNAVRTWVFVRDIDNHYRGMVEARKAFFHERGLNQDTKYIASTGIEGSTAEAGALVSLDTLSMGGLANGQFVRMEALDHLSPTMRYGVTFERGMRIRYGDRSHLFISGTASVDRDGRTMHPFEVQSQASRTFENVRALLDPHGAGYSDLAYYIVYLRDLKDIDRVRPIIDREVPSTVPHLIVVGAVCRPAWLVEFEGVAIIPDSSAYPPFF